MELIFIPLSLMGLAFITAPFLAWALGATLALLWRRHQNRLRLFTSLLWALYGVYEYGMYLRLLCSGECNIRVDLLVIYPLLLCMTFAAVFIRGPGRRQAA